MNSRPEIARNAREFAQASKKRFEQELCQLVEIPTISMDSSYAKEILRGTKKAAEILEGHGASVHIYETSGYPVITGDFIKDKKYPTITLYGHMDVQPAEPKEWKRPPFDFSVEGETYYGRGTTDDKGPSLAALYAASFIARNDIPLNLRILWEMEEENGSPSFAPFLKKYASHLRSDSILVSDTLWLARDKPAIPYALRGLQAARLILATGNRDTHSGTTGGAARNPIAEMCDVVAKLHDAKTGKVKIKDFYKNVPKMHTSERAALQHVKANLAQWQRTYGFTSTRCADATDMLQRIWAQPTFEVHGITGGYQGDGIKTIVPHRAEAKVSMRIVAGQTTSEVFELLRKTVKEINPDVKVIRENALEPYATSRDGKHGQALYSAIEKAFGKKPIWTREGGSIGAVVSMNRILKAPVYFLGLSLPEHGYHEPNENFDWRQASGGIEAMASYLAEVVSP